MIRCKLGQLLLLELNGNAIVEYWLALYERGKSHRLQYLPYYRHSNAHPQLLQADSRRMLKNPPQPQTGKKSQHQPGEECGERRVQMQQQANIGNNLIEKVDADTEHGCKH